MGISRHLESPSILADSIASESEWEDECLEGIITPVTFSPPTAAAAIATVTAESIPPPRPTMTCFGQSSRDSHEQTRPVP